MPNYTTIDKHTDHFNTKLYTGNNSTNAQTGVGFQPDWLWIKCRSHADSSQLVDALRGTNALRSDGNNAQSDIANNGFTSLDSDGFTLNGNGSGGNVNNSGRTYAAWNWKANGQGSSNTDGSINTTYTSVNTTAGFSIITYTGTGSVGTIGHGLGVKPNVIFQKRLDSTPAWTVYHDKFDSNPSHKYLYLNTNGALADYADHWNDTEPTSSVITLGTDTSVNGNGYTNVIYAFAEKTGYSKFGSYVGNGSGQGSFIYTGFKPAFVMIRNYGTTQDWYMLDTKRNTGNIVNSYLRANDGGAESTYNFIDIYSNGFKCNNNGTAANAANNNFIYMAFGQSIVGSNNVCATAR